MYTVFVNVISHNRVDIDCNPDRDNVHYGVVYASVYTYGVAQILFYNIQGLNLYANNKCNNMNRYNCYDNNIVYKNSPQYVDVKRIAHI